MTELKPKLCPLLVQGRTDISLTIRGESRTYSYFAECVKEYCAAFVDGECRRFNNKEMYYEAEADK